MKLFTSIPSAIVGALLLALALPATAGVIPQDSTLSRRDNDIYNRGLSSIDGSVSHNSARSANIAENLVSKRTFDDKVLAAKMKRGDPGKSTTPGATDIMTSARHGKLSLTYHASAGTMIVYWVTKEMSPLAPKVVIANEYEFVTKTSPNTIHTFEYNDVTEKTSTSAANKVMLKVGKSSGDHTFASGGAGWTELTTGNKLFELAGKAVGKAATGATVKGMGSDILHVHNLIITF